MATTARISRKTWSAIWAPLALPMFRALWIASTASNIGTWMQNVGAAWLMLSLNPSATWVALVQTATSLPVFFLGVPAGVIADLIDRRRLLIVTQAWMLVAAAILGFATLNGKTTPWLLLTLTGALGIGSALNAPAWQAIVPELVPRDDLPAAIALNSLGFNLARAVGPALTGVLLALFNPGWTFLLNGLSFIGVIWVLIVWKRQPVDNIAATERALGAMRAGFRYLGYSPALQAVLVRTAAFITGGSALWALLPLVAKFELGGTAAGYGLLLGCLGAGSIVAAFFLQRIRERFSLDQQVLGGTVLFGLMTLALGVLTEFWVVCGAMLLAGFAWMNVMASLNTTAQSVVPEWVRARAMAFYLLVFQGMMAAGGYVWGVVSEKWSVPVAMIAAAVSMLAGLTCAFRFPLLTARGIDFTYSPVSSEPVVAPDIPLERGPVMVSVIYKIDPAQGAAFTRMMQEIRRIRRRDGAMQWMLFQDTADPWNWSEIFLVDSWEEHMRQHVRATVADRTIKTRAQAFHRGPEPPAVTHWIARRPERE